MCIYDRDTQSWIAVTDAALHLFGYTRDEFMRLGLSDICPSHNGANLPGTAFPLPLRHARAARHTTKSGDTFAADVVFHDTSFEGRQATLVLVLERPERRQVQALLTERERFFSALVEHAPEIIARIDRDLRHVYINPAVVSAIGHVPGDTAAGNGREAGVPLELCVRWAACARQVFASGKVHDAEISVSTAGGEKYYDSRMVPELDADGEVHTVLAIARDVTDRKAAERALREFEMTVRRIDRELRALADALPQLVRCYDRELRHVYANAAAERALGLPCASLMNRTHAEAGFASELAAAWDRQLRETFETRAEARLQFTLTTPEGDRHFEAVSIPLAHDDGAVDRVLTLARDVTDNRRSELEQVVSLARQRDAFVREVHHRVKNNLQGVVGLLRQVANKDAALEPVLTKAIVQLQAMAVIHGLQGQELHEGVPLANMVSEIAWSVERATSRRIEYEPDAGTEDAIACVRENEAVAMALVLNELMLNAAKHGDPDEPVSVTSVIHARRAVIDLVNRGALGADFDFAGNRGLGTGLELVKVLVPAQGVELRYSQHNGTVHATLEVTAPVLARQSEPEETRDDWDRRKSAHSDRRR